MRRLSILIMAGLFFAVSGCDADKRTRYKMTVTVETPSGPKTGYAVREVRFIPKSGTFFGEGGYTWKLRGEAVQIDVAPGKTVFALLRSQQGDLDYAASTIWDVLKRSGPSHDKVELWPRVPEGSGDAPLYLPMFVTFHDNSNAKTVQQLMPNDFAAVLGSGYQLKSVSVEAVFDRVTITIGDRLHRLGIQRGRELDSHFEPTPTPTLAQQLRSYDFTRGLNP
ncbi:hypothetical protein [Sphingomonas swuensis]